jgi:hypothetical protein
MKDRKKRDLVVPIIIDAILFARISDKMMGVLNAFNPTIHDFEFEPKCNITALTILYLY